MPFLRELRASGHLIDVHGGLLPNPEALDGPLQYLSPRGSVDEDRKDVGPPPHVFGKKMSGPQGLVDIRADASKQGAGFRTGARHVEAVDATGLGDLVETVRCLW
jgi:hypothetical protein